MKNIITLTLIFSYMRFKDFLITILISTITSLIVIWTLINADIIPTRQQYPQLHLKQTHSGTLISTFNETSKKYEGYIDNFPIEDVSHKVTVRLLHISFEANVTNYNKSGWVDINSLQLRDQQTQVIVTERSSRFEPSSYIFLTIDVSANPIRSFYVSIKVIGTYNFRLTYNLTIIQEIFT